MSVEQPAEIDPLLAQARQLLLLSQSPFIGYLQRHLKIGYNRALGLMRSLAGEVVTPPATDGWRHMLHSENRSPSDPQPPHDKTISAIDTLMALPRGSKPLEEVVTIIRPRSTLALHHQGDSNFVSAFQIAVKHIHCYGYLPKPDKFDAIQLRETVQKVEFLRPFDVLMVTGGQRIGDVSIAPPATPEPGPGGWVVNRSFAILRANSPDDAICLAAFLRSELAWHAIQEMTPGAVRNHFADRTLRRIPIPVMTQAYRHQVSTILKKQEALSMRLNEIRNELHKSRTEIWRYEGDV